MEKSNHIKEIRKDIPKLPGIYKMIDSNGSIIYIGKSKCLKHRVNSYFTKNHGFDKINTMVSLIHSIDYIVTDTHLEARLLECMLIKELKPHFNSQMKHDKGYVYLTIPEGSKNQTLTISLEKYDNSYGPFRSKTMLSNLITLLKNLYPITKLNSEEIGYEFSHHIFPITLDTASFNKTKEAIIDMFNKEENIKKFLSQLEERMLEASSEFRFETAVYYRELIRNLKYVALVLDGYKDLYNEKIIAKIPTTNGYKLFFIHKGSILIKKDYKRLNNHILDGFVKKCKQTTFHYDLITDEKVAKDFINIIYSELLSLPSEDLIYLDK